MRKWWIVVLLLLFILTWFCVGVSGEDGWQNPVNIDEVLLSIRLPRIWVAMLVGTALAASGAALQALFENPLADPSLIGTSGGAALGVVLVVFFGFEGIGIPFAAFLGAFLACLLILLGHKIVGGGKLGLLVMGFVLSALCASIVSLIMFLSDDMKLRSAMNWMMGSFSEAGFVSLTYAIIIMALGLLILLGLGRKLDCLLLGDEAARTMGVSVGSTRIMTIIGAALMTGVAVSLGGVIGFVGMMIPNMLTRSIGGSRTKLIAMSAIVGAEFVLVADTFARWIVYPIDLPVGIVISILGGPFFLWLMTKGRR